MQIDCCIERSRWLTLFKFFSYFTSWIFHQCGKLQNVQSFAILSSTQKQVTGTFPCGRDTTAIHLVNGDLIRLQDT